ncbi:MAG: hypothetical protein MZV63_29005 [Marinilabiliales bacterium]|nr:hypothetical protein [Marinilabiliales bacterium]
MILGLIVGITLFFSDDVMIVEKVNVSDLSIRQKTELAESAGYLYSNRSSITMEKKSTKTTIPFVKNNEFDYSWLVAFI